METVAAHQNTTYSVDLKTVITSVFLFSVWIMHKMSVNENEWNKYSYYKENLRAENFQNWIIRATRQHSLKLHISREEIRLLDNMGICSKNSSSDITADKFTMRNNQFVQNGCDGGKILLPRGLVPSAQRRTNNEDTVPCSQFNTASLYSQSSWHLT